MIVTGEVFLQKFNDSNWLQDHHTLIHQTSQKHFLKRNSWSKLHSRSINVRWSDSDNYMLVKDFFPKFLEFYNHLVLPVQKSDVARLLYLYKFGGLYVDMDYEAHADVIHEIRTRTNRSIAVVQSPFLINEAMQNSFMYARVSGHPFFIKCVRNIMQVFRFIQRGCDVSQSCFLLRLFKNPFTKYFTISIPI